MTVADLAEARSTWNGTDKTSREILASVGAPREAGGGDAGGFLVVRVEPSCHPASCSAAAGRPV